LSSPELFIPLQFNLKIEYVLPKMIRDPVLLAGGERDLIVLTEDEDKRSFFSS